MKIQIINFEVNPEHYQITKMIKKIKDKEIEYNPYHCYKPHSADYTILISSQSEEKLIAWCKANEIELKHVIAVSNHSMTAIPVWLIEGCFEKEVDFEKMCQWLMEIIKDKDKIDLFQNITVKTGKIHKEHDLYLCAQAIWKQHPKLKDDKEVHLFVKEKNSIILNASKPMTRRIHQHHVKGISEFYEYLIIDIEKKKKSI